MFTCPNICSLCMSSTEPVDQMIISKWCIFLQFLKHINIWRGSNTIGKLSNLLSLWLVGVYGLVCCQLLCRLSASVLLAEMWFLF
ncbi:hypothetical protein HanIR_Chr06g0282561 [Helianthus annuus]|nr:hypothetical protein HanIR_Chr06g0282561 [Helianthus annuus]